MSIYSLARNAGETFYEACQALFYFLIFFHAAWRIV
jgi:hypothetical protein